MISMDTSTLFYHNLADLPAPPATPVRLGAIGLGWAARNLHFPSLAFLRERGWPVEIGALCERSSERLHAMSARFPGATVYGGPEELLADRSLQGVLILTPSCSSAQILRQAIGRGMTTFVEKPVAATVGEIDAASGLARRGKVAVQVGYNRRHQPFYEPFRRALGSLRPPLHVEVRFWRATRTEAGFYADTLVHALDFLVGTLGQLRSVSIRAQPAAGGRDEIDEAWRVELASETDARVTAGIEIRPSAGRSLETYDAAGHQRGCSLQHPYATSDGATARFEQYEQGRRVLALESDVSADNVAACCYYGGFVMQMARFINLCAAPSASCCDLDHAASVLRLCETIIAGRTPA